MNKRASSPPRRPRDPVAKAVRTPRFKQRVVPDQRWRERQKETAAPASAQSEDEAESTD